MAESDKTASKDRYNIDFKQREIDSINADNVEMTQCSVNSINAKAVKMEQSAGIFVAAEKIESKNSAALLMVAQEVHGDVRPIFSLPAALVIAGAILFGFSIFKKNS